MNGKLEPKRSKGNGFTHRLSARYKPREGPDVLCDLVDAVSGRAASTASRRRRPTAPTISTITKLGWKTSFGPLTWNGAIYHQIWKRFQFSFLGANSLTVIQNGRDARINGVETDLSYVARRAHPERGRGLHRRQDQGRDLPFVGRSGGRLLGRD